MRRKNIVLLVLILLLGVFSANVLTTDAAEEYIPKAAEKAISESQRPLIVKIPLLNGGFITRQGSAFLVSEDGLIITALHIIPKEVDIIDKKGRIVFGGVPAEFDSWSEFTDVAILKIRDIPVGMRPATLAKEVSLFEMVYAKLTGRQDSSEDGSSFVHFDGLPFRARVVGRVPQFSVGLLGISIPSAEFLYLDHDAKPGFSGGMFVNEKGEVVGVGSRVDGGYTVLVNSSTIPDAIKASRDTDKRIEEQEKKKDDSKEKENETGNLDIETE